MQKIFPNILSPKGKSPFLMNEDVLRGLSKYLLPLPKITLEPYDAFQYAIMLESDTGVKYLAPVIFTPYTMLIATPDTFNGKHIALINAASIQFFEDTVVYPDAKKLYNNLITNSITSYLFGLMAYLHWYSFRHSDTEKIDKNDHEAIIQNSLKYAGQELAKIFINNGASKYHLIEEAYLFTQRFTSSLRMDMFLSIFWSGLLSGINFYIENEQNIGTEYIDDDEDVELDRDVWGFLDE